MQFNSQTQTWKRAPYIAAAAALALAIGVVASNVLDTSTMSPPAMMSDGPAVAPVAPANVETPLFDAPAEAPRTIIYVVASEADAFTLQQGIQEGEFIYGETAYSDGITRQVLVVDSAEDEAALSLLDQELYQASLSQPDLGVTLVDLR
jgi:hypothetical protein